MSFYDKLASTPIHYNYFRDYDPQTGRYVQSDPLGLGGGINSFRYVNGRPTSLVDPLGLFEPGMVQETGVEFISSLFGKSTEERLPMRPVDKDPSAKKLQCMRDYVQKHYGGKLGDTVITTLSANSMYSNDANMANGGAVGNLKTTVVNGTVKGAGVGVVNAGATAAQSYAVAAEATGVGSSMVNGAIFSAGTKAKSLIVGGVRWGGRVLLPVTVVATFINQEASEACNCE